MSGNETNKSTKSAKGFKLAVGGALGGSEATKLLIFCPTLSEDDLGCCCFDVVDDEEDGFNFFVTCPSEDEGCGGAIEVVNERKQAS